jgi:hypothetical protein
LAPSGAASVSVQVFADDQDYNLEVPADGNVQDALDAADLSLGALDRVDPDLHVALAEGMQISVTRVYEDFEVEEVVIPFEQQIQPSEFLAEGEQQPLQLGENGRKEITYRVVFEDGVEVSRSVIKDVVLKDPTPQIMLVGIQSSFSPLPIPGRIAYLSDGNAWLMEETTANRTPLVTSGDLDGRVFSLSDDGSWLLFSRHDDDEDVINTLWVVKVDQPEIEIFLDAENVIHFAGWQPGSNDTVAYSTVEPRQAAPGWQANNDLQLTNFSATGWVTPRPKVLVETNSGGVYGWWGVNYVYSPNPLRVAFAGPDQVSLLNFEAEEEEIQQEVLEITPLQTRSDWAWVPGLAWGPDGSVLYTVRHAPPPGTISPEESPLFNLVALPLNGGVPVDLVAPVGMFAYPLTSPMQPQPTGELAYQVAYLQAIFPEQSETSRYRVVIMDRDGSNRRELFPPPEAQGIDPQRHWGVWSPQRTQGEGSYRLAVLYQGNIWLVDAESGQTWQITGDGRINQIDWQ